MRFPPHIHLALLTVALGYAVAKDGGVHLADWSVSLLVLGLAGLAYLARTLAESLASSMQRRLRWAVLLFPCYVAFQLVPLPVFVIRILSPERAQLFEAVKDLTGAGVFVPLSIQPTTTFLYLLRILAYTLTFLLIWDITARSPARRCWAPLLPLIGIAAVEAGFSFLRSNGALPVHGSYANKNHFAGLLEMALPLAVMRSVALMQQRHIQGTLRILKIGGLMAVTMLIFLGLVYSMSKMGFVSGLFGLFVMGALWLGASKIRFSRKIWLIAGLAFCLFLAFVFFIPDELIQAFGGFVSKTADSEGRVPIWTDTLRLIRAYPLFGCGLGSYETGFLKYQTAITDRDFTFAHNDYLQLAAELGAAGLLILAMLMGFIVKKAFRTATRDADRNVRYAGMACIGGMAAIALHSVADFNMYIPANAMVLAWICGISVGLASRPAPVCAAAPVREPLKKFAFAISCLLVAYAPGWLLFESKFRGQPQLEPVFCRLGICDTDAVLAAAAPKQGGKDLAGWKAELVEAVRRDPAAPQRWCDLGDAMLGAGETENASYCFSRALALGPNIPAMLIRAANFHFALKDNLAALKMMARALALDSGYEDIVLTDYEDRKISTDQTLRYGIPQNASNFRDYLRRMIYQNRIPDAAQTWAWITSRNYGNDKLVNEYVEFLIGDQKFDDAKEAWAHYACARDKSYPESNGVFNGGFEFDPTGSRFDWNINAAQGAVIDFDRAVQYSGARSLRIRFDGTQNVSDAGVRQTVFLKPGSYRFQAYVRTQDVSTDEGVAFRIVDSEAPNRLNFRTESVLGTNGWQLIEHAFQVVPGTGLIQVSLVRKPSLRFDSLIRGTAWIDAVAITPYR